MVRSSASGLSAEAIHYRHPPVTCDTPWPSCRLASSPARHNFLRMPTAAALLCIPTAAASPIKHVSSRRLADRNACQGNATVPLRHLYLGLPSWRVRVAGRRTEPGQLDMRTRQSVTRIKRGELDMLTRRSVTRIKRGMGPRGCRRAPRNQGRGAYRRATFRDPAHQLTSDNERVEYRNEVPATVMTVVSVNHQPCVAWLLSVLYGLPSHCKLQQALAVAEKRAQCHR